jgi:hypothetical protein
MAVAMIVCKKNTAVYEILRLFCLQLDEKFTAEKLTISYKMYSIFVQDVYRMRRTNAVSSMHLFSL